MNVFISWSGERSKGIAEKLKEWLTLFFHDKIHFFVSSIDIEKGTHWEAEIMKKLGEASIGIICVTKDNYQAPWLLFEAGALSKATKKTHVIPFLYDVPVTEFDSPLNMFQSVVFTNKEDIKKLLSVLISVSGDSSFSDELIDKLTKALYPSLEEELLPYWQEEADTNEFSIQREQISMQNSNVEKILEICKENQNQIEGIKIALRNLEPRPEKRNVKTSINPDSGARWATTDEVKNRCSLIDLKKKVVDGAGIPVISDGNRIYVDNSESHTLIIGSTGSGKTRKVIIPLIHTLRLHKESVIILDPKSELYQMTSGAFSKAGYKVIELNFRDPLSGDSWNPLALPYQYFKNGYIDKAMEMLNELSMNIFIDKKNRNDPFWEQASAGYFVGLARGLFEDADEKEINFNSIINMSTDGEDKNGLSTFIRDYINLKGKDSAVYSNASGAVTAPNDTRSSVLSVFYNKLRLYTSQENLSKMLSLSSFDVASIGSTPTVIYVIIQDEKSTYHPLALTFIKQCYEALIDSAIENEGRLKIRTNIVLDEFGNLPPITDMKSIISAARSRNIRLTLAIQSKRQLESVYSESEADSIKNNCNNYIYLYGRDLETLKEISELCGQVEEQSEMNTTERKPLISISQLQRLKSGEAIVLTKENYPYKTVLPDITQYNFQAYKPFVVKKLTNHEIEIFDLKSMVKEEKRRRTIEAIDSAKQEAKTTKNESAVFDTLARSIDRQIAEWETSKTGGM